MKFSLYFFLLYLFIVCESRRVPRGFDEYYLIKIVRVEHGDTIIIVRLNDTKVPFKVRLIDIDTPRFDQRFGIEARDHLKKLVTNKKAKKVGIAVKRIKSKIYGKLYVGRRNINKKMIADGFARCYPKRKCPYSYRILMELARFRKIGLWNKKNGTATEKWNKDKNIKTSTDRTTFIENMTLPVSLNRVIDGDTVYVTRKNSKNNSVIKVRMSGIDSPEMKQSYGVEAKNHLETILFNLPKDKLSLITQGTDKYSRTLGIIISSTVDVNKKMVQDGYAWCYRHTQCPKSYQDAMNIAKNNKKGLFIEKNPVTPWDWRKQQKT